MNGGDAVDVTQHRSSQVLKDLGTFDGDLHGFGWRNEPRCSLRRLQAQGLLSLFAGEIENGSRLYGWWINLWADRPYRMTMERILERPSSAPQEADASHRDTAK